MAIATRLKWFLDAHQIEYEIVHHRHSASSMESARAAHVPGGRVAKSVLLEDERGYVMAIIPASCRLQMDEVDRALGRHLELATEAELGTLFVGCERGAVPPVGAAYNIPAAIDESLLRMPDVYFEAGDHEELVHVGREGMSILWDGCAHGHFSKPN